MHCSAASVSVVEAELVKQQLFSVGRRGPVMHQVMVVMAKVVQVVHGVRAGRWRCGVPVVRVVLRMVVEERVVVVADEHGGGGGGRCLGRHRGRRSQLELGWR